MQYIQINRFIIYCIYLLTNTQTQLGMKISICFFLLLIIPLNLISSNYTLVIDSLYRDIELANADGDRERVYVDYRKLRATYDSIKQDINCNQVEDLRRIYFVDEMDIEKTQHQVTILRMILSAVLIMSLISIVGYYMLKKQKRSLRASQEHLEEMQRQVAISLRNKSLYLSNMSHEIRTPLNALTGFSSILAESATDPALGKQCRELIKFNADMLLNLINEVVDITCLDVDNMSFNMQRVEVVKLCQQVVNTLEGIKQTSATISLKTDLDQLYIETDEIRLQQMLINIMINATKYTPSGSIELQLSTDQQGMAIFNITDTGCGIPLEEQELIFERYRTLDGKVKGTGIGLSLCKIMINKMGGDIWVDKNYTTGSRFVFTHPLKGGAS